VLPVGTASKVLGQGSDALTGAASIPFQGSIGRRSAHKPFAMIFLKCDAKAFRSKEPFRSGSRFGYGVNYTLAKAAASVTEK
jgi:hypothetical protein